MRVRLWRRAPDASADRARATSARPRAPLPERTREILAISAVYTAAWGLLIFATGRYWDDWAALDLSWPAVAEWSRQQGLSWQLRFLGVLSALPGTERIGHMMTFVSFLVCALMLDRVLRGFSWATPTSRVLICAFFAVFPVNSARFALVDLMYALTLVMFMIGWTLIAVDFDRPSIARRLIAAAVLLLAMLSTASLFMFAAIIPVYVAWARASDLRSADSRRRLIARYGFTVLLPIIGWAIRSFLPQPSGLYAGYNRVGAHGVLNALKILPTAFRASILDPIGVSFTGTIPLVIAVGLVVYFIALKVLGRDDSPVPTWRTQIMLPIAGAATFVLAVLPYLTVLKLPQAIAWESRHQLLVPFAAGLLVYGMFALVARVLQLEGRFVLFALCMLLGAFVVMDVRVSMAYQADWYKQVSLMQRMAKSEDIRECGYIVFADHAPQYNAPGVVLAVYQNGKRTPVPQSRRTIIEYRGLAYYEYSGMLARVFGDATRFGVDERSTDAVNPNVMRRYEQYRFRDYRPASQRCEVTITPGARIVRKPGVLLGLMWRETFAPRLFEEAVTDVVRIETRRVTDLPSHQLLR